MGVACVPVAAPLVSSHRPWCEADRGPASRKQRGAWYTPDDLVATIVDNVVTADFLARVRRPQRGPLRVLDPACGDGRFLAAVAARAATLGVGVRLVGVDVDRRRRTPPAPTLPGARIERADALRHDFGGERFDLVIGNPPFLSQMAAATTRGGASGRSGGPYADAAVEFLALAGELVDPRRPGGVRAAAVGARCPRCRATSERRSTSGPSVLVVVDRANASSTPRSTPAPSPSSSVPTIHVCDKIFVTGSPKILSQTRMWG